jgi:predicted dehydrogenase
MERGRMVNSEREVRWGVLSTANIGVKALIPAIQASRNGRLIAIASRDLERAEAIALIERGARAYGDYQALLDDPDVDAVYIPLPNSLHREWAIKAAAAGKHVLCEKPLGLTVAEVEEMYAASERAGVALMEAFMYRFHPQIAWTLAQVVAGRIGEVRLIRSSFGFDLRQNPENIRLKAALGGGSLMDVGCYPLSLSRVFFGVAPLRAATLVVEPEGSEVEVGMQAALDFGGDRRAVIDSGFAHYWGQSAELIGDLGRLVIPRPFTPGRGETVVRLETAQETIERRFDPVDQYVLQVEAFADCVQNGRTPPLDKADALAQAHAIELVYASAGYRWPR